MTNKAR